MVARGDLRMRDFDVLLTSYEMAIIEKTAINKIKWCFIVVDEGQTQPPPLPEPCCCQLLLALQLSSLCLPWCLLLLSAQLTG